MEVMSSAQGTKDQERGDIEVMKELKGVEVWKLDETGYRLKENYL